MTNFNDPLSKLEKLRESMTTRWLEVNGPSKVATSVQFDPSKRFLRIVFALPDQTESQAQQCLDRFLGRSKLTGAVVVHHKNTFHLPETTEMRIQSSGNATRAPEISQDEFAQIQDKRISKMIEADKIKSPEYMTDIFIGEELRKSSSGDFEAIIVAMSTHHILAERSMNGKVSLFDNADKFIASYKDGKWQNGAAFDIESLETNFSRVTYEPEIIRLMSEARAAVGNQLWPTEADHKAFRTRSGDGLPFPSKCMQQLYIKMMNELGARTDILLVALSELKDSEVAKTLIKYGFDIESAKEQLKTAHTEDERESWNEDFFAAKALAGRFESENTEPEHLLLALLRNHNSKAHQLLDALGVDRGDLERALVQLVQTKP